MLLVAWTALLGGAILTGITLVGSMALRRGPHLLSVLVMLVSLAVAVVGTVGVTIASSRVDEAIVGSFLGVAAFLGGFALGGAVLAQLGPESPPALLTDAVPSATPRIGVVLLADAEPEEYEPVAIARELRWLSAAGVDLPPEPMRVFVYLSERARYRSARGSGSRDTVRAVAARLTSRLQAEEVFAPVSVAFCDADPQLDETVARIVADGARDVVIAELGISASAAGERARRRVDAIRPAEHGVRVGHAQPLWASAALAEMVVARIAEARGDAPAAQTGVAVLGYGRPTEITDTDPEGTEHETVFHQRVRAMLIEAGFDDVRTRLGWVEWQEPAVTEVLRHLAALGCTRIIVAPVSMPFDTVSTRIDIPDQVSQSRVERSAEVVVLPAWGDDDVVADSLAASVREAASEL